MKKIVALVFLLVVSFSIVAETKNFDEKLLGKWNIVSGSKFTSIVFEDHKCMVYDGNKLVSTSPVNTAGNKIFIDNCGFTFEFYNNGKNVKLVPYFESASIIILERKK